MSAPYAELQVTSHFSFLRGASSPDELFAAAAILGLPALAVTDRNSLAGTVRAHEAARVTGLRSIIGCRLDLDDGASLLVYPTDQAAYSRLTRLLTIGKRRAGKGACELGWDDVAAHAEGLFATLVDQGAPEDLRDDLARLRDLFGERGSLALTRRFVPDEAVRLGRLAALARRTGLATCAVNDVLMHSVERRILQDVVTCIREGCTIEALGFRRERSWGRWLKEPEEMARLFAAHPVALARTLAIADACRFDIKQIRYHYPAELEFDGLTAQQALERYTWEGAADRYPEGVPDKVADLLRHELQLIEMLNYAPYFLTVFSIVRYARSRKILCQGRGSAANSAVCYVLGVTSINPVDQDLLFERFVSAERREPPDIDIDFEHDRREEVIQWVYDTYGRDHAALAAAVVRYRARGAVREVGKVLGLPEDVTGELSKLTWAWDDEGVTEAQVRQLNLNPADPRLRLTLDLSRQLMGAPRHLSQHPGGFVLSLGRLDDLVPIEPAAMDDRQVIEWDKDDLDIAGMMKVDVLGVGMLGCLRRVFDLLKEHRGVEHDLYTVPQDDPDVYDMICRADTVGVFQIESRAQMSMLPRLKPRDLNDLTIEIAVVRPGPIQGQMVHPYLKRRDGIEEKVYPPHPEAKKILQRTLGIPLFQEQAMAIAIHCAGFSPGEADQLRRAMATFKMTGGVKHFRDKLMEGMLRSKLEKAYAERLCDQLEGFGSYGFPMSHAAGFAIVAYASSWAKHHHPDVFLAAILNSLPMGFYPAAQLVADARAHGVEVRPVDVNHSHWDCALEGGRGGEREGGGEGLQAVRLGFRLVSGVSNPDMARLALSRFVPFDSVADVHWRTGLGPAVLTRLAEADAFSSLALSRRQALWAIHALREARLPLFEAADIRAARLTDEIVEGAAPPLRKASAPREVVDDYATLGLSLKAHPVSFLRAALARRGVTPSGGLAAARNGARLRVAGLVLVRQRPGSAKGVMFLTLEDETGPCNVIVWPGLFERFRRTVFQAQMMGVEGRFQREGLVMHVVAERLVDLTAALKRIGERLVDDVRVNEAGFSVPPGRGDEVRMGSGPDRRREDPRFVPGHGQGGLASALAFGGVEEDDAPDVPRPSPRPSPRPPLGPPPPVPAQARRGERVIEVRSRNFR